MLSARGSESCQNRDFWNLELLSTTRLISLYAKDVLLWSIEVARKDPPKRQIGPKSPSHESDLATQFP